MGGTAGNKEDGRGRAGAGAWAVSKKLFTVFFIAMDMAKELGQIHTVTYDLQNMASGDLGIIDLPGQLSKQTQHRVRMLQNFKVVGIDMAITGSGTSTVSGVVRYFSPTKGRVQALLKAWEACKDMLTLNGVQYWNNLNYDFRPCMRDPAAYTLQGALGTLFLNQASLETVGGVAGPLSLIAPAAGYKSVFATFNEGIQPAQTVGVAFSSGFNVIEAGTAGDMVLNEGEYLNSWLPQAQEQPEEIPFQLSIDTLTDEASPTFQWRPDPALYLSVLTGQMEVYCDISSDENVDIHCSVMVAGWKTIHSSRKTKKMSGSRGRRQRKSTRKR